MWWCLSGHVLRWVNYIVRLDPQNVSSADTILSPAYILFLVLFLVGKWTVLLFNLCEGNHWSYYGVSYFTYYSYLLNGTTISMTAMSSCCAKFDAVEYKVYDSTQQTIFKEEAFLHSYCRCCLSSYVISCSFSRCSGDNDQRAEDTHVIREEENIGYLETC